MSFRPALVPLVLALAACGPPPPAETSDELVMTVRVTDDLCPVGGCPGDEVEEADPICEPEGPDGMLVTQLAAGMSHICALLNDGHVRCWGAGHNYTLGNGSAGRSATPVTVRNVQDARGVAAGRMHACAVTERGAVFCWGSNDWGQLGTSNRRNPPGNLAARVVGLRGAIGVTTGADHSCALTSRGRVQCWGKNHVGQLGDGTRELRSRPTRAQSLTATAVAAGGNSTCAVRTNGEVVCWGDITGTERPTAIAGLDAPAADVAVGDESACARLADGRVMCWGSGGHGTLGPRTMAASDAAGPVDGLPPVVSIRMGATRACAVDGQGITWCWGSREALQQDLANPNRRAGQGPALDTVVNGDAICSAMQSGGVCCVGQNRSGLLGVGFHPFAIPAPDAEWPVPMQW